MEFFERAETVYRKSRTWWSWVLGIQNDLLISSADLFYEAGLRYCLQAEEDNAMKSMSLSRHLYRYIILNSEKNSENYLYALDKIKHTKI